MLINTYKYALIYLLQVLHLPSCILSIIPFCLSQCHGVMETCHALLALDYKIVEVSNSGGELSTNYPHRLLVPESELSTPSASTSNGNSTGTKQTIYEHNVDAVRLREHLQNARLARCRARFPIPVILYRGRFICRSATLSGSPELYGRATLESWFARMESVLSPRKDEDGKWR